MAEEKSEQNYSQFKRFAFFAGPIVAVLVGVSVGFGSESSTMAWTAAITCLCAIWWITEPIPIPATSLIPLAVFPLVGVLEFAEVSQAYGDNLILLMLGGFILSVGMETSGAHRRIALLMVNLCGGGGARRLVFGFMLASAFLSMWISNAATTLMLLPVALAVVSQSEDRKLQIALLIGVAYAASIGGVGTPIGTPPNLMFMKVYSATTGTEPSFADWMGWSLPVVVIMLPLSAVWLTRGLSNSKVIELPAIGKWSRDEVLTLVVFAITATLWMTRKQPMGGWSQFLDTTNVKDSSIAILGAISLFLLPSQKGGQILDWDSASKIPWGILLLFAGGIVIASAFESSGLSQTLGEFLSGLGGLPTLALIGVLCLGVTFLTEVTSNSATSTLLMPILATAAVSAGLEPKMIMVPATISCSFAFMLPVATPPNAIVFGSNAFSIKEMAREGIILNLVGVVVVTLASYWMFQS